MFAQKQHALLAHFIGPRTARHLSNVMGGAILGSLDQGSQWLLKTLITAGTTQERVLAKLFKSHRTESAFDILFCATVHFHKIAK